MKKIKFFASAFMIFAASAAIGQDGETDNREKLQFGFKIGTNYSNVYNTNTEDFSADQKFGLAGGATVHIPIGKYVGIQPEILFSQKGFEGEGSLLGSKYNFSRTSTFIDIPLQIAFKPSEFITIVAGPQYSYLVKQKDEFENSLFSYSQEEEFKNDNIRKNILGVVAGIDINIKHIIVGARAGWDLQNNKGDGSSNTPQYRNAWLQATVGYVFYKN